MSKPTISPPANVPTSATDRLADMPLDDALALLDTRVQAAQSELAGRLDAGEEVLRYLARHGGAATRQAVAANPAASCEADLALAEDKEDAVRAALACKIGRLFPGMLVAERQSLRDHAIRILQKLADDEAVRVRAVLAEEIKHHACVPKPLVLKLAGDPSIEVAGPLLEFSPLLEDEDLIELVAAAEASAMLEAVARRKGLGANVSEAVIATRDTGAIGCLLKNVSADIRKTTLDRIVSQAAEIAEWHGPLVLRAELSPSAMRRIAGFVSTALLSQLTLRGEIDSALRAQLEKKLEERRRKDIAEAGDTPPSASDDVERAQRAGRLDDSFISDAIAAQRRNTIICALARLSGIDQTIVRLILTSESAKAVTALCWKAGLSMRTAFCLQTTILKLSGEKLLPAKRGIDYPLEQAEMRWQLSCFGVE